MHNLTVLAIHAYDIDVLRHCRKLHSLSVGGHAEVDLSSVVLRLNRVEHLELEANQVVNWSPCYRMKNLQYLSLGRSRIADVPPLKECKALRFLNLQHNYIADVGAIEKLTWLHGLYLDHNRVRDIGGLANLHLIGDTTLWSQPDEQIWDLGGRYWRHGNQHIMSVEGVVHLGLSHNQISDIAPLVANPGLDQGDGIDLRGNPLSHEAYMEHIPALQRRGVYVLFDPL